MQVSAISAISAYIGYMIDAFLIYEARRYDIKGKSYFEYPNKYYYTDIGLRNARLQFRQIDPGHIDGKYHLYGTNPSRICGGGWSCKQIAGMDKKNKRR